MCGNGGAKPRHADLLATDLDEATLIKYIDRFLMYYITTADRLTRTSVWVEKLEGGIAHVRDVVVHDSLGLGAELMKDMAHMRGGNAFSLVKTNEIEPFMSENWPWFTVPIAYDLEVHAKPTSGVTVFAGHGFPGSSEGPSKSLEVASVFLSKKRGGLLLELEGDLLADAGVDLELSYLGPNDVSHAATLSARVGEGALDERGVSMPALGVSRATSLAIFMRAMRRTLSRMPRVPAA